MKKIIALSLVAMISACSTADNAAYDSIVDKDYNDAETEIQRALKFSTDNMYAKYNLAVIYQNTNRQKLAVPLYQYLHKNATYLYPANPEYDAKGQRKTISTLAGENLKNINGTAKPIQMPSETIFNEIENTIPPEDN